MKKLLQALFSMSADTMSPAKRWTALGVLSLSLFVVTMDMMILLMALPKLIIDLSPTTAQQLWIVDVYSLILAGLLIPMSALADRWGRKKLLLTGFFIFSVASVLVLFVTTANHVIALRALLGLAGAMIMPTTLSMIRTIFSNPKERATALAIWASIASLGAIAGPVVGGLLLEHFSWHSVFIINAPFALFAVIAGLFLLPEARSTQPPRWDMLATILSIGGMSTLVWSIKHFAKEGWDDTTALIVFAISALLLIGFVVRCLRQAKPMLDVRLFKRRPIAASAITAFFSMFAMTGIMLLIAQWLQVVLEWSPLKAGIATLPTAVGALLFTPLAPAIAARIGARTVLASGLAMAGIGFLYIFLFGHPLTYGVLVPALVLIGISTASLAVASSLIMSSTPQDKAGNSAAIEESMYDLGNVFGVAVIGSIAAAFYRQYLDIASFAGQGISGALADQANKSIVDALAVSAQTGVFDLATKATSAFDDSILGIGLVGGIILVTIAIIVFALIPKGLDITSQRHD